MRRALLLLLTVLCAGPALALDAAELIGRGSLRIRAFVEPSDRVFVGQQSRLIVEILTDTWFSSAPRYPELQLDGAIVLLPEQLAINFTEREGRTTLAGQRQRYLIFPQRAGVLDIPPLEIRLGIVLDGQPSEVLAATTDRVQLEVVMPEAAAGTGSFVTTPRFTVEQSLDGTLDELSAGGAVTRAVTMTAADALAFVIPGLDFGAPEGIAVYPAQPVLTDDVNRGRYTGTRVETATYILEQPGDYVLPEIAINWWNPEAGAMLTEVLPAIELTVAAAPASGVGAVEPRNGTPVTRALAFGRWALDWLSRNLIALTLIAGGLWILWISGRHFWPRAMAWHRVRRQRAAQSEAKYFRDLSDACRAGDLTRIVACFWRWLDRAAPPGVTLTARDLANLAKSSAFAERWATLERARYADDESAGIDRRALLRDLKCVRQHLLSGRTFAPAAASHPSRLNPATPGRETGASAARL